MELSGGEEAGNDPSLGYLFLRFVHCRTDVCLHLSFKGFKDEEGTERPRKCLLFFFFFTFMQAECFITDAVT